MTLKTPEIIGLFALIQLLFLTAVGFAYPRGQRRSNRLLGGFMASNALLIANFLSARFHWIGPDRDPLLNSLGKSSYLLLMPFLYLYIRSLCYKDFRVHPAQLLHFVPFLLATALSLAGNAYGGGIADADRIVQKPMIHLQVSSYLVASAWTLWHYRNRLKLTYSSLYRIDLSWCNFLLAGFAAMWLTDFSRWALTMFHSMPDDWNPVFLTVSLLINLTCALAIAYKGLVRPESFSGILTPPKYAASPLAPDTGEAIMNNLSTCMEQDKPYLDPALTVDQLADALKISSRQLSQAIHTHSDQNFYNLVNRYRVEEAKTLLREGAARTRTFLAIAHDVGFNSKSVFNAAFKKHAGMTPKEYRHRSEAAA